MLNYFIYLFIVLGYFLCGKPASCHSVMDDNAHSKKRTISIFDDSGKPKVTLEYLSAIDDVFQIKSPLRITSNSRLDTINGDLEIYVNRSSEISIELKNLVVLGKIHISGFEASLNHISLKNVTSTNFRTRSINCQTISIERSKVEGLSLYGSTCKFILVFGNQIDEVYITNLEWGQMYLRDTKIQKFFHFHSCEMGSITIQSCEFKPRCTFSIERSITKSPIKAAHSVFPRVVKLYRIRGETQFEAKQCLFPSGSAKAILTIDQCESLKYLDVPFDQVNLKFTGDFRTYDNINEHYTAILEELARVGAIHNYNALERQYKKFVHFENGNFFSKAWYHVQYIWWGFGQSQWRILIWMLGFIAIVSFINSLSRRIFTVTQVYHIEGISNRLDELEADGHIPWRRRFYLSTYFTAILFFGLKMDIGSLKFQKNREVVFIFLIYGFGLVCLAFLVNWLFKF